MTNPFPAAVAFLRGLWAKQPVRVTAVVVAVVTFVALKFGIVVPQADLLEAIGFTLPVLLGGEVARSQVTPTR